MENSTETQLVPRAFYRLCQNLEVNRWSLSNTIETGTPCLLTISLTYRENKWSIKKLTFMGKKWADFVNWSTITQIALLPLKFLGKPVIKSIVICFHFHSRRKWGCKDPTSRSCLVFICWHTKHWAANWAISRFIPDHQ